MRRSLVGNLVKRVPPIKQSHRLFQRPVLCLNDEEPQKGKFACKSADVHELYMKTNQCSLSDEYEHMTDVVLPSNGVQHDRVHILVKNKRDRHHKGKDVEPLDTEAERQNLNRV